MDFYEAKERASKLGFDINVTAADRTWFSSSKRWDYTGQTFSMDVKPETNQFRFTMIHGLVVIDSTWLGSFDNDEHFLRFQKIFMETIEKLKPSTTGRCWDCDGKGVGLDWGDMAFWECKTCKGTGELE